MEASSKQHKTQNTPTTTTTTSDHGHDHQAMINISSKISPHDEEINGWKEVSRVAIPERWGQEDLLKDWMDYSTFDSLLAPQEAASARQALVAEIRARRRR